MSDEGLLTIKTKNTVLDEDFIKTRLEADPGEYVLLSIADTGHGMEKETQNRIFEPFFTTKNPGRGTGLGLSMVYGIVKNHQGYIECSSKPTEGTRFNMYFPILKSGKIPENKVSNNEEKIPTGDETILMVDDEESILDVGEKMLQQFGYSVTTACSAEKAIEIYRVEKERIDLVILDINMPGIGGHKCLERLLEINPAAKTIVTSGSLSAEGEESLHKMGAAAFIEKPYQFKALLVKIRKILDNQDE
jgi:CheY-like chemotaxis protein